MSPAELLELIAQEIELSDKATAASASLSKYPI